MSLTEYDEEEAKKVFHDDGYNEGVQAGAAQQKVKDDLILAAALSAKDAALSEKDAEIARLKAQLASK
ncbi:MAG: hypothetical protein MJ181_00195 [Treponema sp.]|nr:hypothetical protein [Treponema sp.]